MGEQTKYAEAGLRMTRLNRLDVLRGLFKVFVMALWSCLILDLAYFLVCWGVLLFLAFAFNFAP